MVLVCWYAAGLTAQSGQTSWQMDKLRLNLD